MTPPSMVNTPNVWTQASVPHHCWHNKEKNLRIQVYLEKGTWDVVTRVTIRGTILIAAENSNYGTYNHTY